MYKAPTHPSVARARAPSHTDRMPLVELAAILLFLSRMNINWMKSPGLLFLAIWLILMNLVTLVPLIASLGILLNLLGVAAGVLILIGR